MTLLTGMSSLHPLLSALRKHSHCRRVVNGSPNIQISRFLRNRLRSQFGSSLTYPVAYFRRHHHRYRGCRSQRHPRERLMFAFRPTSDAVRFQPQAILLLAAFTSFLRHFICVRPRPIKGRNVQYYWYMPRGCLTRPYCAGRIIARAAI